MRLSLLLIIVLFSACSHQKLANSSSKIIYSPRELSKAVPFVSHTQEKTPYLAMNIYYPEINSLRLEVEKKHNLNLKNRGEAHITILTPMEAETLKSYGLNMSAIDELAQLERIQQIPFEILCVGEGRLGDLKTYFLVVKSEALLKLRKKILDLVLQINPTFHRRTFQPEEYFPHITLGFTERDLHIQDGVRKDKNSCAIMLQENQVN